MEICHLTQLSPYDKEPYYIMLQTIGTNENEFKNPVNGMTFKDYKKWLKQQYDWSRGENLPDGYVRQTCYWLMVKDIPVGIGKIRHSLTDQSRQIGGNIGYAISSEHRGKGYGTILLKKLIEKTNELGISEKLLTVEKYNYASKKVIEKNGGKLIKENEHRWFFEF